MFVSNEINCESYKNRYKIFPHDWNPLELELTDQQSLKYCLTLVFFIMRYYILFIYFLSNSNS
jgi:hypothetical protein